MNTAMAVGICGRITAQYVFSSRSVSNSRNCGTISTWPGIMMPASTSPEHDVAAAEPHPGQRERGHAGHEHRADAAVSVEMMKLARYQLGMSVFCSMRPKASNVGLSIGQVAVPGGLGVGLEGGVDRPAQRDQPDQREGDQHAEADPVEELRPGVVAGAGRTNLV